MPIIGQWLKKRINSKIEKCNIEIKQLKDNHSYNGMRESWRNVWKEILTHYHDSNISNSNRAMIIINSEALALWQNEFIEHCQLLVKKWQDKFVENYELLFDKWQGENNFLENYELLLKKWQDEDNVQENCELLKEMCQYQLLVANGKKICEIAKNLTTDICSDHEFQKKQLLNIIGNNPFLKRSEFTKPLATNNWNQDVREQCNSTVANVQKPQSSSYLRYVTRR